jgi:hypothetical protein
MQRQMLAAAVVAAFMVTSLAAQEPSTICSLVTAADATTILGIPAKQTKDPSGCGWEDATHKHQLNVAYVMVPSMFARARSQSATEGKTQDEQGLGGPAFSTIPTSHEGTRIAVYCLKGSTVMILDLSADGAPDRLPQLRDVMRKVVAGIH